MVLILLALWFLSTHFLAGAFWQALVAIAAVAMPLALHGLYEAAIAKTLRRERYQRDGRLFRLFAGRLLLGAIALMLVLLAAPFVIVRLHVLQAREWLLLALLVPLQLAVFTGFMRLLQHEYKPWLLTAAALDWTRFVCPTLLALLYAAMLLSQRGAGSALELPEAIELAQRRIAGIDSSLALATLAQFLALIDGSKAWFLANVTLESRNLVFYAAVLDFWMICYFLCRVLAIALLPRSEWRRVFGPLTDARDVPVLAPRRIAIACALFTFVTLFVGVPLLAGIETQVRARPHLQQLIAGTRMRVERIGEEYFAPGTIAALERARRVALARLDVSTADLRAATDAAFTAMEGNVDLYLDWYYSLGAEYARIGHLLAGDLEDYMARRFAETLAQDDLFADVERALAASLVNSAEANALYTRLSDNILAQNRIAPPPRQFTVVQQLDLRDVLAPPEHAELLGVQNRLLLASGGGAMAGVLGGTIAGKLVAKVVTKSSFKLATQAAAKLVASKAAGTTLGAGAGATAGGAIGSIVPGFGTAIGALIGGVLGGLAVGVGIDKALIEFEEAVGREAFRAELLQALDEARRDYLSAATP
ncbi:MAG TPA: hypothetical protein VGE69_06500 [Pseudomonadales bacterium]